MAEKYKVRRDEFGFGVTFNGGKYAGHAIAHYWFFGEQNDCPNAEREARNLCRRLNAAAKKWKVKR